MSRIERVLLVNVKTYFAIFISRDKRTPFISIYEFWKNGFCP